LPDDEYPFASVTSLVTLEIIESVAVAAFDAEVYSAIRKLPVPRLIGNACPRLRLNLL
jgi:hypothetical protein